MILDLYAIKKREYFLTTLGEKIFHYFRLPTFNIAMVLIGTIIAASITPNVAISAMMITGLCDISNLCG